MNKIAVLILLQLITIGVAFAWGPERETYTNEYPAPFAVFNSITNNVAVGDERNFVRIGEVGSNEKYTDTIEIEPGKEYEVYIYYHNNAASSTNETGFGIATNVRVSSVYPVSVKAKEKSEIRGIISWSYVTPDDPEHASGGVVWDEAHVTTQRDEIILRYKPGTAIIHNGGKTDGSVLPRDLFTTEGTPIGFDKMAGIVPGCAEYSGYITYTLIAEVPSQEEMHPVKTRIELSKLQGEDGDYQLNAINTYDRKGHLTSTLEPENITSEMIEHENARYRSEKLDWVVRAHENTGKEINNVMLTTEQLPMYTSVRYQYDELGNLTDIREYNQAGEETYHIQLIYGSEEKRPQDPILFGDPGEPLNLYYFIGGAVDYRFYIPNWSKEYLGDDVIYRCDFDDSGKLVKYYATDAEMNDRLYHYDHKDRCVRIECVDDPYFDTIFEYNNDDSIHQITSGSTVLVYTYDDHKRLVSTEGRVENTDIYYSWNYGYSDTGELCGINFSSNYDDYNLEYIYEYWDEEGVFYHEMVPEENE